MKENTDIREEMQQCTPLSRIASADELVEAVQFLASEGAGFMTGQIITVDGGRTLLDPMDIPAH